MEMNSARVAAHTYAEVARPAIKRLLKEARAEMREVMELEVVGDNFAMKHYHTREEREQFVFTWRVAHDLTGRELDAHDRIKKYEMIDREMAYALSPTAKAGREEFESLIPIAKAHPIVDLLKFDRARKTSCIFHKESTASMHYYPKTNTVFCFGCSKAADSIEIAMCLWSVSFTEAVRKLATYA